MKTKRRSETTFDLDYYTPHDVGVDDIVTVHERAANLCTNLYGCLARVIGIEDSLFRRVEDEHKGVQLDDA